MYKVKWSEKYKNIPILVDSCEDSIIPPRPVFFEELDLLGFDKYFKYPKSKEPLMWAIGRDYYYDNKKVAKAVGGDIYNAPKLEIYENNLELIPVDLDLLIKLNRNKIEVLKNEAIEFIKKVYKDYKDKVDFFVVAFSGGKDSQVLLDLVTIALEPDKYKVIFTDTTMELPETYETVKRTEKHYKNSYEDFKITTVRNPTDAEKLWRVFGPPSRTLRWCCSVYKTSPVHNYLKSLNKGKHPRTILFDGVRRDESNNRANHLRVADSVKHNKVINTRPIIEWNDFEVFLYIFFSNLNFNDDYRSGSTRVGCNICPFASEWGDFMTYKKHKNIAEKFVRIIREYSKKVVNPSTSIDEYLSKRLWKMRAGGNSISLINNIEIQETKGTLKINLENSNENIFEWLKVLGDYKIDKDKNNLTLKIDKGVKTLFIEQNKNKEVITANKNDIIHISHLKKVAYKTSYCVHCGSCEAECPTGALKVFPKVQVDTDLCIHCSKCLDFHNKGCVMANSVKQSQKHIVGITKYNNFGMRKEWVISFLNKGVEWLNGGELGKKQRDSLKNWFKDSGIYTSKNNQITDLYSILKNFNNNKIIFEILFINLSFNSQLIHWYLHNIKWNEKMDKIQAMELLLEYSDTTRTAADLIIRGLFNFFDTTPLGTDLKIGYVTKEGTTRYIQKLGTDEVSNEAILYSLYKLKEKTGRGDFRVKEFYEESFEGGPYKIFGISKEALVRKLKFISEDTKLIDVNLIQGLDNIFLKDLTPIEVLKEVLK